MKKLPIIFLLIAGRAWAVEHYDPEILNQRAAASVREDDLGTAEVLLSRATLLSPKDSRIARNLKEVRAQQNGMPLPANPDRELVPGRSPMNLKLPPLLKTIRQETKQPVAVPEAPPPMWK